MRFTRKPYEVEARRWEPDVVDEDQPDPIRRMFAPGGFPFCHMTEGKVLSIGTTRGALRVYPGWWLVAEDGNEWRAYSPEDFSARFELAQVDA